MRKNLKQLLGFLGLLLLGGNMGLAQYTTVTATVVDSDSTVWANAPYSWSFQPGPNQSNPHNYTYNGAPLAQFNGNGAANGSGVISVASLIYDVTLIRPIGASYNLTICPNASTACATINIKPSGGSMSVSSAINAAILAPRFPPVAGQYGYLDAETSGTLLPGSTYWNTTSSKQRCYDGSAWADCGGGSGTVSDGAGTTTPNLPAVSTAVAHTIGYAANPLSPSLTSPLGATYTLWVTGKLALAQTAGSGYSGTGTCTLTGGTLVSGSADTCTATQSGGAITFAIVGTGVYSVMPSISFGGVSAGTGAWANVYNDPANTTIYVRDESTGIITNGADLNPLMTTIFNNSIGINLHVYFKNGWYPINTLTQSANSGCTNYYAGVFIPSSPVGSWTQNLFTGESGTTNLNEAAATEGLNLIQTNGVIWYVTATADATVSSGNFVAVEWQDPNAGGSGCLPNTYSLLANEDFFENITFRRSTQRAHSGGAINWSAESTRYKGTVADFAVSYNAIATGSAPPADTFGMTSSYSFGGEVQEFQQTSAIGWNLGYDWGELTKSYDSEAAYNNYPFEIFRTGNTGYHNVVVEGFLDQENLHGPIIGGQEASGARVDLIGYDIEFGTANWYARTTPNAVETNPGYTYGLVTYTQVEQGGSRLGGNPFFSAGGSNMTVYPSGTATASGPGVSKQLASYTFTVTESPLSYGGNFSPAGSGAGGGKVISAGIYEPLTTSTGAQDYFTGGVWPNDQCSKVTVKAIQSTSVEVLNVRMSGSANTSYQLNFTPAGMNLYAYVTGTAHQLGTTQTITASANDTWEMCVQGSSAPVLTIFQNGAQIYQQTDSTYGASIPGGFPGFGLYDTAAITNSQFSSWAARTP